jgi:hypothetical protein
MAYNSLITEPSNILYIVCGNKMPTRCNRWFLLQILLLAQHVSGTIMPIIRSSRLLYRWLLRVVFGALVFKLSVWCGAAPHHTGDFVRTRITVVMSGILFISCVGGNALFFVVWLWVNDLRGRYPNFKRIPPPDRLIFIIMLCYTRVG